MAEPNFDFYDKRLLDLVINDDENTHQFFRLLALCHTVMPEEKEDGKNLYVFFSPTPVQSYTVKEEVLEKC